MNNVKAESRRVGILMSCYNECEEWIRNAIESILHQTYQNFRFYILLDNPENTRLREILEEYKQKDNRIEVHINEKNIGLVQSLNRLITLSDEELIARMDADDISVPERIEKELGFLDAHDLDFVMSGADFISEQGEITKGNAIPTLTGEDVSYFVGYGNPAVHPTWLLKREVYRKLNGYREVSYCEDFDLLLRALQAGFKVGRMGDFLLHYRLRESGISSMYAKEQSDKADYLRKWFVQGGNVQAIKESQLNEMFSHYSEKEKRRYAESKQLLDEFMTVLYNHNWWKCIKNCIYGFLTNADYRRTFLKATMNKITLLIFYRKVERRYRE